jgi:ribosomal protein S18 acetylase RimI-like enzyme
MVEFNIRKAVAEDALALSACITSAYAIYKDRIQDLPEVADGIASSIDNNSVWVAQMQEQVVGAIVLVVSPDHLLLENIAVHPDSAGNGIGKALIRLAESECLELGLHEVRLSTHRDIIENINLYKHLGWHIIDDIGNKIYMSKTINF